jgi:hypothetical protein
VSASSPVTPKRYENDKLTPSYAALIRLIEGCSVAEQSRLLGLLVDRLQDQRPHQTLKAWDQGDLIKSADAPRLIATADTLETICQTRKSLQLLERFVEIQPQTLESLKVLGRMAAIYRRLGETEKEKEFLRKAQDYTVKGDRSETVKFLQADVVRNLEHENKNKKFPDLVHLLNPDRTALLPDALLRSPDGRFRFHLNRKGDIGCVQNDNNAVRWLYPLTPSWLRYYDEYKSLPQSAVFGKDLVLVPNAMDGVLHAVDLNTGRQKWVYTDWTTILPPVLIDDRVYLGNAFGDLRVLSRDTGERIANVPHPLGAEGGYSEKAAPLLLASDRSSIKFASHCVVLSSLTVVVPEPKKIVDASEIRQNDREKALVSLTGIILNGKNNGPYRAGAMQTLAEMSGRSFIPNLMVLLGDPDPIVRSSAAHHLGRLGNKTHVDVLLKLLQDANPDVQCEAACAVVRLGGLDVKPRLQLFLDNASSEIVHDVALTLLAAGDRSVIPAVKAAHTPFRLQSGHQRFVMSLLCSAEDPESLDILSRTFDEAMDYPCYDAIELCEELGNSCRSKKIVPILGKVVLNNTKRYNVLDAHATSALADLGDEEAVPYLIRSLPDIRTEDDMQKCGTDVELEANAKFSALERLTGHSFGKSGGRWRIWWNSLPQSKTWRIGEVKGEAAEDLLRGAARKGEMGTIQILLDQGVNVNARSKNGLTPLVVAIHAFQHRTVEFLLDKGADVNARTTPEDGGETALMIAVKGHYSAVVDSLLAHHADPNLHDAAGKTALHLVFEGGVRHYDLSLVRGLIGAGADSHAKDGNGVTPVSRVKGMLKELLGPNNKMNLESSDLRRQIQLFQDTLDVLENNDQKK